MASRHAPSPFEITYSPSSPSSSSFPTILGQSRPPHLQVNSSRSTLRSAEEQLRYLKEGDTSWQRRQQINIVAESSNSRPSSSSSTVRTSNGDRDAKSERTVRVYLHHVRKTDTLPFILLAYEISGAVLRKSNRLWATDSIRSRDTLHLPVDECAVKPERCIFPPQTNGLLDENCDVGIDKHAKAHGENGEWPPRLHDPGTRSQDDNKNIESEWVKIPGIGPVQIVTLPAHKLSYFPTKQRNAMERSTSLPTLHSLVAEDKAARDSMDSVVSRSSIGSLVEDGVGRIVRFWHDNQGKKKWAKIGKDLIEL
jgi:hypothetical protein